MPKLKVAIAGATGYAGEELLRLLLHHPQVHITHLAASAKWDRPTPVSVVFPRFTGSIDLPIEAFDASRFASSCDLAFLALPHGTAMSTLPSLLKAGKRVIDLSGDFRLQDASLYPRWYAFTHAAPHLLNDAALAYGLTEFHRGEIARASAIANPGCYATSILLAVLPLFAHKAAAEPAVIVDAKSGLSGAGRKPDAGLLYTEMTDNLRPYKVNAHQHMPEVLQALKRITGAAPALTFVPQMIPATRGLISVVYVKVTSIGAAESAYQQAYQSKTAPFVRVRAGVLPQLRDVVGTNFCDIGFVHDPATGTLIIGSAIDNLTKGAAGQAIQNMNVMMGWPETEGLLP
jgi:N-acetyl-gamma-glutamyl-phosphate reductase